MKSREEAVFIVEQWFCEWKTVLLVSFVINVAAYAAYMTHITYSVDDYDTIFQPSHTIVSGRWVIDFVHNVVFRMNLMPTLMPLLCIACSILTGIGLCSLWGIRDKVVSGMVLLLWGIHPYFFEAYNFRFAAFSFALGYGLAVAALLCAERGKSGFFLSVLLFYLTLSIYQPIFGFAAAAAMIRLLLDCVRTQFSEDSVRTSIKLAARYLLIAICSIVVYLVLTHIIFAVFNIEINSRFTGNFIHTTDQIIEKAGWTFIMLVVRLLPISEYIMPFGVKIAVFAVYLLGLVCIFQNTPRWKSAAASVVWLALIPLAAIAPILPLTLAASSLPWRVCLGLAVLLIGLFVLTQESRKQSLRTSGFCLGVFLIVMFVFTGNKVFYQQYISNQKDVVTAAQILSRLQNQDTYCAGMPLAIVGRIEEGSFSKTGKTYRQIFTEYTRHCSTRRYSLAQSAFGTDWSKYSFLLNYLDVELKQCSWQQLEQAQQWAKNKSAWPAPSSVFIQDNVAVIVLSVP